MDQELKNAFNNVCRVILRESREHPSKSLDYAIGYCQAGLNMSDPEYIQTQALYILCNITHWRSPLAPDIRKTLKIIGGNL